MVANVVKFPETPESLLRLIDREVEAVNDRVKQIMARERKTREEIWGVGCCPHDHMLCMYDCEGGCYRETLQ